MHWLAELSCIFVAITYNSPWFLNFLKKLGSLAFQMITKQYIVLFLFHGSDKSIFFPICTNFSACSCILLSVYIFPPLKSFYQFHGKIATPRLSSSGLNASCIAHCCFSYPITGFSWPCFMILSHFFTNILFICGLINGNCYRTFTWTFALLKGTWFVRTRFKKSHSQVAVPFHQFGSKMGFI